MRSVLFVCTANICRSPMAMGLLRARVDHEKAGWRIESAGVLASPGYPPALDTQFVLRERGIAVGDTRSQMVSQELLNEFNLILTMERGQKEALRAAYPQFTSRIFLLSEMVGGINDVVDPIGRSMIDFEDTAREIDQVLLEGFDKIRDLAEGKSSPNES